MKCDSCDIRFKCLTDREGQRCFGIMAVNADDIKQDKKCDVITFRVVSRTYGESQEEAAIRLAKYFHVTISATAYQSLIEELRRLRNEFK